MTMRRIITGVFMFVLLYFQTLGQDIHFSQFYYSPLTTNPAQTGFFNGKFRFAANYRDQWSFVPLPYRTFSASFDMHVLDIKDDILAGGIYFISDKAGNGGISTTGSLASVAYHKNFGNGTNSVAIGMQGGLMQIGFDPNILRFGDQIENQVNGVDAATSETFSSTNLEYFDFNTGLLWNFIPNSTSNFYIGVSLLHLTSPSVTFLNNLQSSLSPRMIIQSGVALAMGSRMDLLPSILYMKQGGNKEFYFGSSIRFNFAEKTGVRFGGWYRLAGNKDAAVLMTGLDYRNFKLGISYDMNISSLKQASNGKGGPEIALIYIITPAKAKKRSNKGVIFCPVF